MLKRASPDESQVQPHQFFARVHSVELCWLQGRQQQKCPRVKSSTGRFFQSQKDAIADQVLSTFHCNAIIHLQKSKVLRQMVSCQQMFSHAYSVTVRDIDNLFRTVCKGNFPVQAGPLLRPHSLNHLPSQGTFFPLFSPTRAPPLPLPKHNT